MEDRIDAPWGEDRQEYELTLKEGSASAEFKINNRQCRRCIYSCILNGGTFCDYLGKTGRVRGCETSPRCKKFKRRA